MNSGQLLEGVQIVSNVHLYENREKAAIQLFIPRPLTLCPPPPPFFLKTVLPITANLGIYC